ncbi:hypothetical protein [Myxococcus stipitatus]|uniref:hypothetical protein n=1 Tax=Myxococcus stipitatus TaxID=83455 RepID=UPI0030D5D8C2
MSWRFTFVLLSYLALAGCNDRVRQERRQKSREFLLGLLGAAHPALVEFLFTEENQLAAVHVHFVRPESVREHFEPLAELLELKYGLPATYSDTAVHRDGEPDPFPPDSPQAPLRLESTWKSDETFVRLTGVHQPDTQSLTIQYESTHLKIFLDKAPRSLELLQREAREHRWRAQVKEL